MVYYAIIFLILGIVCGNFLQDNSILEIVTNHSNIILYLLMFTVGISVGINKQAFYKIKEYHIKILIIPIGIIVGTIIGGFISSLIIGMNYNHGMAIASGLGWYSLSGVMLTNLVGVQQGTIAFLSNLFREILAFIMIPFLAKYFNYYTAIAPAAATSEDTTLSMLIRYTNEEVVVMAIINGVLCSAMVPILIRLFLSF